ncbi:hypothetical protein Bbelb_318940 [Branchiostoma belcheri]|nr:hypothetical protein Bbelb_318940 [Branchiostoma belcheri]
MSGHVTNPSYFISFVKLGDREKVAGLAYNPSRTRMSRQVEVLSSRGVDEEEEKEQQLEIGPRQTDRAKFTKRKGCWSRLDGGGCFDVASVHGFVGARLTTPVSDGQRGAPRVAASSTACQSVCQTFYGVKRHETSDGVTAARRDWNAGRSS